MKYLVQSIYSYICVFSFNCILTSPACYKIQNKLRMFSQENGVQCSLPKVITTSLTYLYCLSEQHICFICVIYYNAS